MEDVQVSTGIMPHYKILLYFGTCSASTLVAFANCAVQLPRLLHNGCSRRPLLPMLPEEYHSIAAHLKLSGFVVDVRLPPHPAPSSGP